MFTEWLPIKSSNLQDARYDVETGICEVRFQGNPKIYVYGDKDKNLSSGDWNRWSQTFQEDTSSHPLFRELIKDSLAVTTRKG